MEPIAVPDPGPGQRAQLVAGKNDYYFQSMVSPSVYWVDLAKVDLSENAPGYNIDAYDRRRPIDIASNSKQMLRPRK